MRKTALPLPESLASSLKEKPFSPTLNKLNQYFTSFFFLFFVYIFFHFSPFPSTEINTFFIFFFSCSNFAVVVRLSSPKREP